MILIKINPPRKCKNERDKNLEFLYWEGFLLAWEAKFPLIRLDILQSAFSPQSGKSYLMPYSIKLKELNIIF